MSLARSVAVSNDFLFCIPLYKPCSNLQVLEYFSERTFTPLATMLFAEREVGVGVGVGESEKSIKALQRKIQHTKKSL